MVDANNNGFVTASEIVDSLGSFGIYVNRDDVYLFVKRYDRNNDGKLRYSEFCDAFNPKDYSYSS
jgi:Ca2+-binding EF-hand superfamily protein